MDETAQQKEQQRKEQGNNCLLQQIRRSKIFGKCKGCDQPNTYFNECAPCQDWISIQLTKLRELKELKDLKKDLKGLGLQIEELEYQVEERISLINQQTCYICCQPKHIHCYIAACGQCGYPEISVEHLYQFAIEAEDEEGEEEEDGYGIRISDLLCPRCDSRQQSFLQCPDYLEVLERIRLELNEMDVNDPDYQNLSQV